MPPFHSTVLVALLGLAAPAAPVADGDTLVQDDGLEVLEAAAERYAGVHTVCADFIQELDNPLLGEVRTSSGRLCQRRPNLFRMDFSDPDGDEIVADGRHFWVFYRSLNPDQVIRFPLDPTRGGLDFFREFLDDPGSKYRVRREGDETVAGVGTARLALTPREPRGLTSARVWVDTRQRLIRRIEATDDSGLVRTVELADVALDPTLPETYFQFELPAGVSIVDGG